jgi:hypothetical protein
MAAIFIVIPAKRLIGLIRGKPLRRHRSAQPICQNAKPG